MLEIHNLHNAMGSVKMQYVSRDRIYDLANQIITSWSCIGKVGAGGEHTAVVKGNALTSGKTLTVTPKTGSENFRVSVHKQRSEDAAPYSNPQKRKKSDAVRTAPSPVIDTIDLTRIATTIDLTVSGDEDAAGGPSISFKYPAKHVALDERVRQAAAGWGRLEFNNRRIVYLDPPVGVLYVMGRDPACDYKAVDLWTNSAGISVMSYRWSNNYSQFASMLHSDHLHLFRAVALVESTVAYAALWKVLLWRYVLYMCMLMWLSAFECMQQKVSVCCLNSTALNFSNRV